MKITYSDLVFVLSRFGEISFEVEGDEEYGNCWMGNLSDAKDDRAKQPFWFGLTPDGKQAYEHATMDEMVNAPVFRGQSLKSLADRINILSINGCEPEIWL